MSPGRPGADRGLQPLRRTDIPIVDTHLRVWDLKRLHYPWLEAVPPLNRTFLLEDYKRATGPLQVAKMVFVQCECLPSEYRDEVRWVSEVAREDGRIQGIVSWAPLEKGEAVLPELAELSRNPLVKGIRRIIQFEADADFCLRPDFIRGVRLLPRFGWTFDICISPTRSPRRSASSSSARKCASPSITSPSRTFAAAGWSRGSPA
jgi:L-fuconolactonase